MLGFQYSHDTLHVFRIFNPAEKLDLRFGGRLGWSGLRKYRDQEAG
jgi:hypothetical protein